MADPYVYEGTTVLKNLIGTKDQSILDDYETTVVQAALLHIYKTASFDTSSTQCIFKIHEMLFSNVYDWAGRKRTMNIYKQEQILAGLSVEYSKFEKIETELKKVDRMIATANWDQMSQKKKYEKIAKITARIWQIHPFREGNTRTVSTFLFFFAQKVGIEIDMRFLEKNTKYFRNALVLASLGQYSELNHLVSIIEGSSSANTISKVQNDYSSIKGYNLDNYKYNYHTEKK